MPPLNAVLRVDSSGTRVLVTDAYGHDLVKARLPVHSEHPRALLTLLEGLALYCGHRLYVAVSVAADVTKMPWSEPLGEQLYPLDSALVRFEFIQLAARPRRLRGMGRFHQLRRLRLLAVRD
jgi:hypothetical protein